MSGRQEAGQPVIIKSCWKFIEEIEKKEKDKDEWGQENDYS